MDSDRDGLIRQFDEVNERLDVSHSALMAGAFAEIDGKQFLTDLCRLTQLRLRLWPEADPMPVLDMVDYLFKMVRKYQ